MYRYILRESCSQFDSLPLTSLTQEAKAIARAESAPRVRAALVALAPLDLPPTVVETAVEIARAIALRHVGRYFRGECLPELRYQLVDHARKLAKQKKKKAEHERSRGTNVAVVSAP